MKPDNQSISALADIFIFALKYLLFLLILVVLSFGALLLYLSWLEREDRKSQPPLTRIESSLLTERELEFESGVLQYAEGFMTTEDFQSALDDMGFDVVPGRAHYSPKFSLICKDNFDINWDAGEQHLRALKARYRPSCL